MTTLAEKIAVMQAAERGELIQCRHVTFGAEEWSSVSCPSWDWSSYRYRVSPKEPRVIYVQMAGGVPMHATTLLTLGYAKFIEVIE